MTTAMTVTDFPEIGRRPHRREQPDRLAVPVGPVQPKPTGLPATRPLRLSARQSAMALAHAPP